MGPGRQAGASRDKALRVQDLVALTREKPRLSSPQQDLGQDLVGKRLNLSGPTGGDRVNDLLHVQQLRPSVVYAGAMMDPRMIARVQDT